MCFGCLDGFAFGAHHSVWAAADRDLVLRQLPAPCLPHGQYFPGLPSAATSMVAAGLPVGITFPLDDFMAWDKGMLSLDSEERHLLGSAVTLWLVFLCTWVGVVTQIDKGSDEAKDSTSPFHWSCKELRSS